VEGVPVSRRTKVIGATLVLLAIVAFASWPLWKKIYIRPVSARMFERTKAAVEKNPQLQPAWDEAMQDGVLTFTEASDILGRAGEKVEPDE
jgi:hypothetical protein